jgi:hypothetical protein
MPHRALLLRRVQRSFHFFPKICLPSQVSLSLGRFVFASDRLNECNRDLDEAAGAADATACSRDGYFLIYKICVLSDNRLRCAVPTVLDDLASGTPEAIK